jgi:hypothetical protein
MNEEVLLTSIMMDIEPRDINREIMFRERKTYLIDSPLRAEIEVLILSGNSFSHSIIKAYEQHTEDLEERLKNFEKGYVLLDNSALCSESPPHEGSRRRGGGRSLNRDEYDKSEITRLERGKKMQRPHR